MSVHKSILLRGTTLGWQRKTELETPIVQITLAKDGKPDRILTLSPIGMRDYFTSLMMEYARDQPISEATFEKLAGALQVEVTEKLRSDVYKTIIDTTLMIIRKWYSPRVIIQLLKDLKRDTLATIANTRGDHFAEFVIATIEDEACQTKLSTRKVINRHIDALSEEAIKPGKPDEEARRVFFEDVVDIARRHGDTSLALPPRDDERNDRTTPLFEFATQMRDLIVDYGTKILDRRQLKHGRFDGFALDRDPLIYHLEDARKVILREKPDTYS
jgi:hypothetical protein